MAPRAAEAGVCGRGECAGAYGGGGARGGVWRGGGARGLVCVACGGWRARGGWWVCGVRGLACAGDGLVSPQVRRILGKCR